jgi:hypothetical protein
MAIKQLSLSNLKDLDGGKADQSLQLHLKRAALDCEDRPNDPTARRVTLDFSLVPVVDERGFLTEVHMQIHAKSVVPAHRTKVYSLGLRNQGMLVFAEDSPDSVNQGTILPDDQDD